MPKPKIKQRRSGNQIFREFLDKNRLSRLEAARLLKVAPSFIHYWIHGTAPSAAYRQLIEKWTQGEVPANSWLSSSELDRIDGIEPFRKASVGR